MYLNNWAWLYILTLFETHMQAVMLSHAFLFQEVHHKDGHKESALSTIRSLPVTSSGALPTAQ